MQNFDQQIHIRLSQNDRDRLEQLAQAFHLRASLVARMALRAGVAEIAKSKTISMIANQSASERR